jgi:hypothetical protein
VRHIGQASHPSPFWVGSPVLNQQRAKARTKAEEGLGPPPATPLSMGREREWGQEAGETQHRDLLVPPHNHSGGEESVD